MTEFLVLVVQTDAATRCGLHGHYLLSALPQSLTLKDPQSRQPLLTWPYPFLRKFGQDQVNSPLPSWGCCLPRVGGSPSLSPLTLQAVFSFEAGRRSDSGEGTFTFSTPRAPELCRAVAAAIACQQQGKDTLEPRLFCVSEPQLFAKGLDPQPWGPGNDDPQPSPALGGTQPASHPPANLLRFTPPEPEASCPIVYASIARGQQPLFVSGQPGSGESWAVGKPLPEHLYENIFTAEPHPAGAQEEEEEGQWELGCRQAPEGHSSEGGPVYDNRAAMAPTPRAAGWGRGGQEALSGRSGHKPHSTLRAKLVRLLSRESPGARDWA